jgi:HK97 family phage portal protein
VTLLAGLFGQKSVAWGTNTLPTTLTVRDDIITSDTWSNVYGAIALSGDYTATYEEIARTQLWVRTAINKLAYTMGSLPLKTFQKDAKGNNERVMDSPLARLMHRPNDTKLTGTTSQLVARMVYDLYQYANCIVIKIQPREDADVSQLRPASPRGCIIEDDGTYVWNRGTDREKRVPSWRIIHLIEPGPQHNGMGVSRLEAARLTLSIEYAAQRLGASTFNNGARPGGIINVKGGLPTGEVQRTAALERFKAEIVRRFGGVSKAGLPAVLEGDVTWQAMSHNLDDSAVVAHRQLTRMEVAALFDIPQPAIGILDEANFASIDALHLMLYQDTLQWPINLIEEGLQQQLIDGVRSYEGQFVEFDLNAVLRGDIAKRATAYNQLQGVYTPAEFRRLENLAALDPVEHPEAYRLHIPLALSGTQPPPTEET